MSSQTIKRNNHFKLGAATVAGTTLEYYDFFIYGTSAALVFGKLFFPSYSPLAGTLAAFATFAVGFFARPVGAVIFGHLGDRLGRRTTLIWSLALMGGATVLIGCLPTEAQIGWLAPALLVFLRFAQGIALGGEYGGAALMLVEHAPDNRRGFYGSLVYIGAPGGLLLATAAVNISTAISGDAFTAWGWRLPFLASSVLFIVTVFIRLSLEESPVFAALAKGDSRERAPIGRLFKTQWRDILLAIGVVAPASVLFYVVSTYAISYGTTVASISSSSLLNSLLLAATIYLFAIPLFGWLSDVFSLKAIILVGCAITVPSCFLLFTAVDSKSSTLTFIVMTVALAGAHAALIAPQPALLASRFDPRVRFTGVAVSQTLSVSVLSGSTPFLATLLFGWTGSTILISSWVAFWGLVGAAGVVVLAKRPVYVNTEVVEAVVHSDDDSTFPVV
ncbi:MFS transporter [Arthrobacter sp. PAMC25564]|uniref:MFS transporter n=1 Tax=Arthrobacter sp. PAMC25564 TaxID=2565366 RepID=UPI0010A2A4F9|nr:MFS transporter [Arthrobacter sp. PAMC25564]QCB97977.1 MFS transporter [Arthrobacter sp. PAMC25564]